MSFENITVDGFKKLKELKPSLVLIDVRTAAELESDGMIAGAKHIPLHAFAMRADELDPNATTVIYCKAGGRSAQACSFIANRNFKELYNLQGGIMDWVAKGNPVVRSAD